MSMSDPHKAHLVQPPLNHLFDIPSHVNKKWKSLPGCLKELLDLIGKQTHHPSSVFFALHPQKKPSKNRRMKECGRMVWRNEGNFFSFLTWMGRIAVSRVDKRWSKNPRMVIMEFVMLWLFPRLSHMNCTLATNSSTLLNNPIPQFPPTPPNPTLSLT